MVTTSFRRSGLHHVLGAIGSLSLFALIGFTCGGDSATAGPSTLAPIMTTGAASAPASAPPSRTATGAQTCPWK